MKYQSKVIWTDRLSMERDINKGLKELNEKFGDRFQYVDSKVFPEDTKNFYGVVIFYTLGDSGSNKVPEGYDPWAGE